MTVPLADSGLAQQLSSRTVGQFPFGRAMRLPSKSRIFSGVRVRAVHPPGLGLGSRYSNRCSSRLSSRSRANGGRAQYRSKRSSPARSGPSEALCGMNIHACHPWRNIGSPFKPQPGHPVRSFDQLHPLLGIISIEIALTGEVAYRDLTIVTISATLPHGMDRRSKLGSCCFASPKIGGLTERIDCIRTGNPLLVLIYSAPMMSIQYKIARFVHCGIRLPPSQFVPHHPCIEGPRILDGGQESFGQHDVLYRPEDTRRRTQC